MGIVTFNCKNVATTAITENSRFFSKDDIMRLYSDVFADEVGLLEGRLHLEIDKVVQPVELPVPRMPIAMHEKLGKELDRLEQQGIIVKVDVPTDWVSSVVVERKKNGKLWARFA